MTYYTDGAHPEASDANAGNADHPFLTIGRGFRALKPGDTLQVRASLYREQFGEVRLLGTADAPIEVVCDPGVIVRPTTLLAEAPTPFDAHLWSVPAASAHRLIECDAARWTPILVHDPNGVHFELARPVPTHPVKTLDQLYDVPGSSWYDTLNQRVLFQPYGSCEHGLEALRSCTFSIRRATHTRISGLTVEYGSVFQLYETTKVEVAGLSLCGMALQLMGTKDCTVRGASVEQVITRGPGFLWYDKGAGMGMQITDTCQRTTVSDVTVRHGWNGVSWSGTETVVDGATIYGFPNHNFGIAGTHNLYRNVKAYQAQEGLFAGPGTRCIVEDCEIERAIVLGGGHTLAGKAMTDLVFRRNTILGSGMINAADDCTLAAADDNYWITTLFDWRYQNTRATALAQIRDWFGFEQRSVWDNRNLPR